MTGTLLWIYLIYGTAAVGLTIWLARTLFASGQIFLEDVFEDRPAMADAVNRLLVVGFYMLNLGYALLIFRGINQPTPQEAIELLVNRLGVLLASLGVIHFLNIFVFWRIRDRQAVQLGQGGPPPLPSVAVGDGERPGWN